MIIYNPQGHNCEYAQVMSLNNLISQFAGWTGAWVSASFESNARIDWLNDVAAGMYTILWSWILAMAP